VTEKPERWVLDTSALLTLIEDEDGAARVEDLLRGGGAIVTWVSLLEIPYVSLQRSGRREADRRYTLTKRLPVRHIEAFDEPTILTAGRFKAAHRLSLADALIAAVAKIEGACLVHKDPEFDALADEVRLESLPLKTARRS
jgi:ribonuclease VapC